MIIYFLPISIYLAAVVIYCCQEKYFYYKLWGYYAVVMVLMMAMVGVNMWGVMRLIMNF